MRPYVFSPEQLTPEQRANEVARILGTGLPRPGRRFRRGAVRQRNRGIVVGTARKRLPVAGVDSRPAAWHRGWPGPCRPARPRRGRRGATGE